MYRFGQKAICTIKQRQKFEEIQRMIWYLSEKELDAVYDLVKTLAGKDYEMIATIVNFLLNASLDDLMKLKHELELDGRSSLKEFRKLLNEVIQERE